MGENIKATISAISDPGMVRSNNEDSFLLIDLKRGKSIADHSTIEKKGEESVYLLIVSDGVGGSQLGELASELTVLSIKDAMMLIEQEVPVFDKLTAAVEHANHLLFTENTNNPRLAGMKATVTAVVVEYTKVYVASVGDSRAYLIRNNEISQLTTDQTLGNILVEQGILKPEDVSKHPRKNVILQAIGNAEVIQVAVNSFDLLQGDMLLLCSDGLTNKLTDDELYNILHNSSSIEEASKTMVQTAKERGGEDNITVVIAKFEGDAIAAVDGQPLELQELSTYDPYTVKKSSLRTTLLHNVKTNREISTVFPIEIKSINSEYGDFVEQSETLQLGLKDASFLIKNKVNIDDLLYISLPMPPWLRLFDPDKPLYQLYAQVRKISPQESGFYLVRVSFISKDYPDE
ncbi:MAG: serine/threonine-protein phosphatase [Blastocatellia bacterium]|nr:serine/threonine-protein phosphatase [Blastocatellia bacterium]